MKKALSILFTLGSITLSSCNSPQSYGVISSEMDPRCKRKYYIANTSTDKKITFVLKYTEITKGELYTSSNEQPVGPQETVLLGCNGTADSIKFEIVGAYISNNK